MHCLVLPLFSVLKFFVYISNGTPTVCWQQLDILSVLSFLLLELVELELKSKYPLTEYAVNTSFYCIILRLSFANSISNVLSNCTTLMVRSHLGVLYPKFVYCLVLPLFFLLSLFVVISRGNIDIFFCSILLLELSLNKNCKAYMLLLNDWY